MKFIWLVSGFGDDMQTPNVMVAKIMCSNPKPSVKLRYVCFDSYIADFSSRHEHFILARVLKFSKLYLTFLR